VSVRARARRPADRREAHLARLAAVWAVVAVVVGSVLLSGCGAPRDGTRTLAVDDVPYRLLDRSPGPAASPQPSGEVTVPRVYLVDADERLVPQPLRVQAAGLQQVVSGVLSALMAGPSDEQRSAGLGSALGPEVRLEMLDVADRVARIEVDVASAAPTADRLPLAVGQVVLSATSVQGVDRILLVHDGHPVQAPLPGGAQTSEPLSPADYATLLAPGSTTPDKAEPTT
jgi:hypothetical protein